MIKLERIMGIVAIVSILMKLALIHGAGIFVLLSLMLLAGIYYPFGFVFFNGIGLFDLFKKDAYKAVSKWRIVGAIAVGICLSAICMGIMFKIQYYPGANVMLVSGLEMVLIVTIVAFMKWLKQRDDYYIKMFKRIAIIGGFGLVMALTPALTIEKIKYHNYPNYIKAMEEYLKHPKDEALRQKMLLEYRKVITPTQGFRENTKGMSEEPLK